MSPRELLLTVGVDHHPFGRLVGWIDSWLDRQATGSVHYRSQHGTAPAPRHGEAHAFLPHEELQRLLARADVLVMQGGPMGIVEAQRLGKKPVVIPRLSRLGEVVDDHQVAFCRLLGDEGSIHLVESSEDLDRVLDAVTQDPSLGQLTPPRESNASAAAQCFRELVDGLRPRRSLKERARDTLRRR